MYVQKREQTYIQLFHGTKEVIKRNLTSNDLKFFMGKSLLPCRPPTILPLVLGAFTNRNIWSLSRVTKLLHTYNPTKNNWAQKCDRIVLQVGIYTFETLCKYLIF